MSPDVEKESMLNRAIRWIRNNHVEGHAMPVTHRNRAPYPEVTGYFIPTLLGVGEVKLAEQFALWLVAKQNADGSFSGGDSSLSFVFDTGQVIRGWVSIVNRLPQLRSPLKRACDWIVSGADPATGRLSTPAPGGSWSLGSRGEVSEGVHLYVLKPLLDAADILADPSIAKVAKHALQYYLANENLTDFQRPNMLTHFFGYIQEALIELGHEDKALKGMASVAAFQQGNGAVTGYHDVPWVCSTGLAQLAKVWYLLGDNTHADRAMEFLSLLQNSSGGFYGSYGVDAMYFPADEIPWAVKYAVESEQARIACYFNRTVNDYTATMPLSDDRVQAILNEVHNTRRVLDVGCGNGRYAARIKQINPDLEIHAVDISSEMLSHVSEDIQTQVASIQDLPYIDGYFDLVYCVEALEHAPNPDAAIVEMARVVSPDGRLVIIDKNLALKGMLQIQDWERWFDIDDLTAKIETLNFNVRSQFVGYDGRGPDGLFVAWIGTKIIPSSAADLQSKNQTIANGKTLETNLSSNDWHDSITRHSSPNKVADSVRQGNVPKWIQPILSETAVCDSLLELGSGTGELSAFLALSGRETILLDFSSDNLDFAAKVYSELELSGKFVNADVLERLPFADDEVDVVWSSGLLEHFEEHQIQFIVSESARVARKRVISLVPNATSFAYLLGKKIQEHEGRWIWGKEDPRVTLIPFFQAAGLLNIREYSIDPIHALSFMDKDELQSLRTELAAIFSALPTKILDELNQGYLLVTIGDICSGLNDSPYAPKQIENKKREHFIRSLESMSKFPHVRSAKSTRLKIGMYIGSWPQNIGNAFFDFGSMALVKLACPDAILYPVGGAVHWMFNHSERLNSNPLSSDFPRNLNSIEIGQICEVDLLIFAGMSMCSEFVENNGRTFVDASKRGVAVLGLGAGANLYTEKDTRPFSAFFNELKRAAVLTRDTATYEIFKKTIDHIEDGIDCAFFLPNYYTPPKINLPKYDVVNFDGGPIPQGIDHGDRDIIYTHHDLWGPLPSQYIEKPKTLVSDVPEDYLTLYSQVSETHSDRVHACVASLAYGNKARLYSKTPRSGLFEKVGIQDICDKVCSVDMATLDKLKERQIHVVRNLINGLLPH